MGIIAASAVALAAVTNWAIGDTQPTSPTIRWLVEGSAVDPFSEVGPEAPLRCELTLHDRAWVYAASFDRTRGCLALLPSEQLRTDLPPNPIPAGVYVLPGTHQDKNLLWHTGDAPGPLSFLVVVSREPIEELQETLPRLRQVGNGAFPTRAKLGTYAPKSGMESAPPQSQLPTDTLNRAFGLLEYDHDGPLTESESGLWVGALRLEVKADPIGDPTPDDGVKQQIKRELSDLLVAPPK